MKILIVDDDNFSIMLLLSILNKISNDIICVGTGMHAIDTIRENPEINLILLDIVLPDINGYEVTGKIREINQEVLIIAQTAQALSGDREKSIEAGCDDYIAKPYKRNDILDIIQKHFVISVNIPS